MAFRTASYGVASIFVSLANYQVDAATASEYFALPSPGSGQGRIQLLLTRTLTDHNEPPLVTGQYDFSTPQGKAELTGEAHVLVEKGFWISFEQSMIEGEVEVTTVTPSSISGRFNLKDKWTAISGTFTSPVR
jgi:hypothetical protein